MHHSVWFRIHGGKHKTLEDWRHAGKVETAGYISINTIELLYIIKYIYF